MWNLIDNFLNDIAKVTGYDREKLSFVAELCSGGPTVHPNSAANVVVSTTEACPGVSLPSGWYDNLGSNHLENRVIVTDGEGEVQIPRVMYSFQHHVFSGCCMFAIQRWVRCVDEKWTDALQKTALAFRKGVAKVHGVNTLFVSSGPSGASKGGELYDEFDQIHSQASNGLYSTLIS